jgi:hypothetical protein
MRFLIIFLIFCLSALAQKTDRQRAILDELRTLLRPSRVPPDGRLNASDRTWEDWQRRTGELPPSHPERDNGRRKRTGKKQ